MQSKENSEVIGTCKTDGNVSGAITASRTPLSARLPSLAPSTQAVHGDDPLNVIDDVAPPIHLTTTFRYAGEPNNLHPLHERPKYPALNVGEYCYSRNNTPGSSRLENVLSLLLKNPSIVYSSGLSAFYALLVLLTPKRVSIGGGYHGCHDTLELYQRTSGCKVLPLDCNLEELSEGDLIHLETPVNPTGLAFNIQYYAERAHARGAYLSVDSTFAPPPLQDPFNHGADIVMHSGTKFIGGHSDFLCGVLAVKKQEWAQQLFKDRRRLGSIMNGFDTFLGMRSIRTLELRVLRQSGSAGIIVNTLHGAMACKPSDLISSEDAETIRAVVKEIHHASLQTGDCETWLKKQMPNGFGSMFLLVLKNSQLAKNLPSKLLLFHHATSLGGVESLIEWRIMSDPTVSKDVLRISVGVEDHKDLLSDLIQGFRAVLGEQTPHDS